MHIKLFDLENYIQGQLKVNKIKPIYDFLLKFNSKYLSNLLCFQVIAIRRCTYSHLTFRIAFKVKFKSNKMKPMYEFLLLFNCIYLPNLHCFQVIASNRRCTNGHLTLKIALKGKLKANRMNPIYDSLLMFNSNNVPNLYCFQVLAIRRCFFSHLTLKIVQGQIQGHQNEANIWLHIGVQY